MGEGGRRPGEGRAADVEACRVPMDEHDRSDVAGTQTVLRQVARKNHVIQFFDHGASV
jgi:hypothetical protein